MEGQPIAPDDEQGEEDNDEAGADEPQLLTDNGEHKVVVLLGEEHVLLTAVAQPGTQQAARTDGDLGLPQLVAVSPQVAAGVEPGLHTGGHVLSLGNEEEQRRTHGSAAAHKPVQPDA